MKQYGTWFSTIPDNVTLNIDGVLYLRVRDPYNASYGVEDPEFAITQLAQTTMRSEIGKITLDTLFRERDNLNAAIVIAINQASEAWGIQCMRYEIRDIRMPARVAEAMQMQVEAERKKRAAILESEGVKTAEINIAEGKKQARILESGELLVFWITKRCWLGMFIFYRGREAAAYKWGPRSGGGCHCCWKCKSSIHSVGFKGTCVSIASLVIWQRLMQFSYSDVNGSNAAALAVAEKYVTAFGNLARTNNTLILPSNTGDVSSMVTQVMHM